MEDKSIQRVSKDSLAAALPAARAGHSLLSSPCVKWVPNALSLLSARGRWKASKQTSFITHGWIIRTTPNEIKFAKNQKNQTRRQKILWKSISFLPYTEKTKVSIHHHQTSTGHRHCVFRVSGLFPFRKNVYRSVKTKSWKLSIDWKG